jgi:hypothetical protein
MQLPHEIAHRYKKLYPHANRKELLFFVLSHCLAGSTRILLLE